MARDILVDIGSDNGLSPVKRQAVPQAMLPFCHFLHTKESSHSKDLCYMQKAGHFVSASMC